MNNKILLKNLIEHTIKSSYENFQFKNVYCQTRINKRIREILFSDFLSFFFCITPSRIFTAFVSTQKLREVLRGKKLTSRSCSFARTFV